MPASSQFRLSITRALSEQLGEALEQLTPETLDETAILALERRPGVYQLYEDDTLVYVGKAETSLPGRLIKHYKKIVGRLNIGQIKFTCLYVDEDLHSVAPENNLIKKYKDEGKAAWNFNGFGSNDPGKERDTTKIEDNHFDAIHPIDLAWICEDIEPDVYKASELLKIVKRSLPYLFRYESAPFHDGVDVEVREVTPTAEELFTALGSAIAAADNKWQITVLPGWVIMYPKKGPFLSALATFP